MKISAAAQQFLLPAQLIQPLLMPSPSSQRLTLLPPPRCEQRELTEMHRSSPVLSLEHHSLSKKEFKKKKPPVPEDHKL